MEPPRNPARFTTPMTSCQALTKTWLVVIRSQGAFDPILKEPQKVMAFGAGQRRPPQVVDREELDLRQAREHAEVRACPAGDVPGPRGRPPPFSEDLDPSIAGRRRSSSCGRRRRGNRC
jgi:hypothetical protein